MNQTLCPQNFCYCRGFLVSRKEDLDISGVMVWNDKRIGYTLTVWLYMEEINIDKI